MRGCRPNQVGALGKPPNRRGSAPETFERDQSLVHRFYNRRRAHLLSNEVKPNRAHTAISQLEQNEHVLILVITQNIDDLHERAETINIIHKHGELLKSYCQKTGNRYAIRGDLGMDG